MPRLRVCREVILPDPIKLARYQKAPEHGPRLLFFSGGSALRGLSRELIGYTHNSLHVMTAFDSGGSSAVLRRAFAMPSIGDIRARLMDLADQSIQGNPEIYLLFAYRFSKEPPQEELVRELERMAKGKHPLVAGIPDPMRKIIRHHLRVFEEHMPRDFDLRGASVGNLVLTAGYLENRRHLDPILFIYSKLVEVRGTVRPVLNKFLHLTATLESGRTLVGQHLLTGKEAQPLQEKVREVYLTDQPDNPTPVSCKIRRKLAEFIGTAELICYPMGSFYSSLIANLLPTGVGAAVANNACPKVYIPSSGVDPETFGLSPMEQIDVLLRYLKKHDPDTASGQVLNFVLMDRKSSAYQGDIDKRRLAGLGLEVIDCPLVTEQSAPYLDPRLLAQVLVSLV